MTRAVLALVSIASSPWLPAKVRDDVMLAAAFLILITEEEEEG